MSRIPSLALAMCLVAAVTLEAQQNYSQFDSVEIDVMYPDNWERTIIAPQVRAAFTDGHERSFVITRSQVNFPQSYNEAFAEIEERYIREEYPRATVTRNVVAHKVHGQILQLDFTVPGVNGRNPKALRLRHVSIPLGRYTYRITCVSKEEEFKSKYDRIFSDMINSLIITVPKLKEGS